MKQVLAFFLMLSLLLAVAETHAGGIRGGGFRSSSSGGFRSSSFGARSSSSFGGGFRSGSSSGYRSFSSSPSRTYTYGRSAAAPCYSASAAASRSTYHSSKKTVVNNHYHGGSTANGSGGRGMMDYLLLNEMVGHSHDRGPTYVNQGVQATVVAGGVALPEQSMTSVVYQEESHFWRNFFLLIVGGVILYGFYRLLRLAFDE